MPYAKSRRSTSRRSTSRKARSSRRSTASRSYTAKRSSGRRSTSRRASSRVSARRAPSPVIRLEIVQQPVNPVSDPAVAGLQKAPLSAPKAKAKF